MIGAAMVCLGVVAVASGLCVLACAVDRWRHNRADTVDHRYEQARDLLSESAGRAVDEEFTRIIAANGWEVSQ